MNIASLSINRPVLAMVMSIVIILFGVVGYTYLGVREFPSVDPPIVTVQTNYVGANAEIIESQITEPLEESINGIAGIRSLTSVSSDGRSSITIEFDLDIEMETAANDVRDRVARAVRNLPPDADPPIVVKADASDGFILSLTIQSDRRNLLELTDIAINTFKERLQTIPGVSQIVIWGEKRYAMKLMLDPDKMTAYGITPLDVRAALNKENVELPTGRVEGYKTELSIRTMGRLTTVDEFNELILKEAEGAVVRMKDIGEAVLAPENERTLLRGNHGIPMVAVAVNPQPDANYIEIADEFYRRVEQLRKEAPEDLVFGMALDATTNIRSAIDEVIDTIFIAFGLVVLVIFVFLRSWRTTMVPVLAIPISLIGGFFIMYVAGFSINILTLLAIVLATGLVVDDAIVVLENIYAKIEKGMDPIKAGHQGSKEIYFAVISTTVTLVAVFLPVIFLEGFTGRLFREFGIVVAGTVIISTFVSLTLTPMLSAHTLRKTTKKGWFFTGVEYVLDGLSNAYSRSLASFMKHTWIAIVLMFVSLLVIYLVGKGLPSELAPMEDKGRFRIVSTAPEGTSYEMMDEYIEELMAVADTIPELESLLSVTAPGFGASVSANTGFIRVTLTPPTERERTQGEIADQMSGILKQYNFARSFVVQDQTIGGGRNSGLPVQFVIQAPNFQKLKEVVPVFMDKARQSGEFQVIDLDLKFNKPELVIEIDRDRAKALGVSVMDIAETLQLYFSGQRFGYFIMNGKQYQVIGQADRIYRDDPQDVSNIYVRNNRGQLIQLNNVVKMTNRSSPPQLYRYNRYVSATISASTVEGTTLGEGINEMKTIASEVLDDTFATSLAGTSKEFEESSNSLLFAFLLALILIYLSLAAQFESFVNPLVIMLTVPLAVTGAVLSLWLFGQTINIFSQIGIIVLVGIVTKNGILIVEFANQRREDGLTIKDAAFDAAAQRFRPILMTSLATVLGALPIALALGAAAKSRVPMGTVIIGGLLFSLLLTLYVIPALYTLMPGKVRKIAESTNEEV